LRNRTTCYGPILHRRVGREVRGGMGLMARVGNMSSGTCMREAGANSARGPELNDQIVIKGRAGMRRREKAEVPEEA
jgi:hypothetical protein